MAICKISEIHLNELVSFKAPLDAVLLLVALKRRFNPRLTIYVHDYFMVCPSYNLLNNTGQYCQLPELPECILCLQNHPGINGIDLDVDIVIWRNTWGQLLAVADNITCFSNSSKSILTTAYKKLREHQIVVSPHQVEYISPVKFKPNKNDSLHIGVLGAIGIHKGFNLIKEMLGLIAKENLKVKLLVIGYLCEMLDSENLLVTGEYRREDLPALVEQHQIDIFFLPAIWPETFSFTTEEVMMMELPVAVFDIGAPAERVKNYEKGLVIKKIEAGYALEELLKFAENLGR